MNKFLTGSIAAIAMAVAVPALAADLAPRYSKAPALAPVADQIKAAPKEGMAMGIAMKSLAGQPVDSDDVKAAVAALRQ